MPVIPTLPEIEELLAAAPAAVRAKLSISVLRTVTVEGIEPYLRYWGLQAGFDVGVEFGDFDTVVQESIAPQSPLLSPDRDVVLVFMPLATVSPLIAHGLSAASPDQVQAELDRLAGMFHMIIDGIRQKTNALVLWQGFEAPLAPSFGIVDGAIDGGQAGVVARLNALLQATLQAVSNAFVVDLDLCLRRVGASDFYDPRYRLIARAPYKTRGLFEIAAENFKFIRAAKGLNKKCLVLDCDNTLWGGIIGEDGLAGIKIGPDYPGSAFTELQREILNLYHRGVILCLCSKNNPDDVWEVFDKHPDMVLRRQHIAAARINWSNKAENLRALAAELNIGVDSLVFLDDSDFEANLIRESLPEVAVIQLPKGRLADYAQTLADCGLFDALRLTAEDRKRGEMYKVEAERKRDQAQAVDLPAYLRGLQMNLEFGLADEQTFARIAQQTQKTNQFNLTTRRYNDAEIVQFSRSNRHDVIWLRVADKFGDLGVVGTAILAYQDDAAEVDTLLMSCRALGRGIEAAFVEELARVAQARGAASIVGEYIPTAKNQQVENFYPMHGFSEVAGGSAPQARRFQRSLSGYEYRRDDTFTTIKHVCETP